MQKVPRTKQEVIDALTKAATSVVGEPIPSNTRRVTDEELHEVVARCREALGFERDLPLRPRKSN